MKICKERVEMLKEIMALCFSELELNLYLDTHPMDQGALILHNQYVAKSKELVDIYECKYDLLTSSNPSVSPWQWISNPWPWEIDYEMGGRS